jgi:hypothetical protein
MKLSSFSLALAIAVSGLSINSAFASTYEFYADGQRHKPNL